MRIIDPDQSLAAVVPWFYKAGALAAWTAALLFRRNMDAEWALLRAGWIIAAGPSAAPDTISGWFALLQQHPLPGLILLNFFDLLNYALLAVIFLSAAAALRNSRPFWSLAAGTAALAGSLGYFLTNRSLALLALSRGYAAAAGEAQRAALLAAGQVALAVQRSNSYAGSILYPSFLLVTLAGLALSIAMLGSGVFSRRVALVGLLANACGAGYYLALAFAPALTFLPLSLSAVFLLAWYLMLGRRLWTLGSVNARSRQANSILPIASRALSVHRDDLGL